MMERRAAMNEPTSERRLIEACQQGDREAFRQLFEAYRDRVWSIALHFSRDEVSARDITQQVFLKLFTSITQFRHSAGFETWLYRIVVNACLDEQRSRRRFISFNPFSGKNDAEEGRDDLGSLSGREAQHYQDLWGRSMQEDNCAQREIAEAVMAAIRELKPKLRIAILLKYFEELSYQDMAHVLGCSAGTVASRLNRGHRELARKLAHLRSTLKAEE
jgi:RNA polymerase sigma-70 factor, ECF subfamily